MTAIMNHDVHPIPSHPTYSRAEIAAKAEISPDNLVVRFSEAVDGFPLPKGHDVTNCDVLDKKK
jgi:hypothetical protein